MKLTKEQYDALPDMLKALCVAEGEGYEMNIKSQKDVDDEIAGLKSNNEKLLNEKREAARLAKEREDAAKAAADELARKNGDVSALDKSYQEQIAKLTADNEALIGRYKGQVNSLMVDSVANKLATSLGGDSAAVFLPHIKSRLSLEEDGEGFKTRVLGLDGKPSALTVEQLEQEFRGNKAFSGSLVAPASSGLGGGQNLPTTKPLGSESDKGVNISRDAMVARAMEIAKQSGE